MGGSAPAAALPAGESRPAATRGTIRSSAFFALVDQGFNSLNSILPAVALIVLTGPATYGQFAFIFTLVLIAASLQYGAIGVPILVHIPQLPEGERDARLKLLLQLDVWVRIVAGLATAGLAFAVTTEPLTVAAAGLFAFAYLSRETARNRFYAEGRSKQAAMLASAAFVIFVFLLVALFAFGATAASALIASALASFTALLVFGGMGLPAISSPAALIRSYLDNFGGAAWSLANSASNEVQTRFHVLFIGGFRGLEGVGIVEAGRLIWMPCMLLMSAWQRVAQPRVAEHVRAGELASARRLVLLGTAATLAAGMLYAIPVYLLWPLLRDWLFHSFDRMAPFVVGWAVYTALLLTNWNLIIYLNATRQFRAVAMVSTVATCATAGMLLVIAFAVPLYSTLVVMALVQAGVLCRLLALVLRAPTTQEA